MNDRSGKPEDISEKMAPLQEGIARVTSILADMSANTTESLDRLQKGVNKLPGKWELRIWMLIVIGIMTILKFLGRG